MTLFSKVHELKNLEIKGLKNLGFDPYGGQQGVDLYEMCNRLWKPVFRAVKNIQRREDIFIAGHNQAFFDLLNDEKAEQSVWVMSMGHFMGLFDSELFGLRPTGKMINIRYTGEWDKVFTVQSSINFKN